MLFIAFTTACYIADNISINVLCDKLSIRLFLCNFCSKMFSCSSVARWIFAQPFQLAPVCDVLFVVSGRASGLDSSIATEEKSYFAHGHVVWGEHRVKCINFYNRSVLFLFCLCVRKKVLV